MKPRECIDFKYNSICEYNNFKESNETLENIEGTFGASEGDE